MPTWFGIKIDTLQHAGLRIETRLGKAGRGLVLFEQGAGVWPTEAEVLDAISQSAQVERYLQAKGRQAEGGVYTIPARAYVGREDEKVDLEIGPVVFAAKTSDPMAQVVELFKTGMAHIMDLHKAGLQVIAEVSKGLAEQTKAAHEALATQQKAGQETLDKSAQTLAGVAESVTNAMKVTTEGYERQVQRVAELQVEAGADKFGTAALGLFGPILVDKLRAMPDPKPEVKPNEPETKPEVKPNEPETRPESMPEKSNDPGS